MNDKQVQTAVQNDQERKETTVNTTRDQTTNVSVLELYRRAKEEQRVKKSTQSSTRVNKSAYYDLKETATVLNRSIYRIRQMYWEGKFKTAKKVERRVYIAREEVEQLKSEQKERVVQSTELTEQRLYKRIVKSTETIMLLVKTDQQLTTTEKNTILQVLTRYNKEASENIQEDTEE
uniref:Putative DNA binding, helix-turn-helix domain containing protein n=1 Tax=viral metagenome TaxID=1070528 RepID=A0A6M3L4J1_9ZZZZ